MITKIGLYKDPRKKRPWVVRWYGEYDPGTDKERRYSKSFKLKRDAEEFQNQQIAAFKKGQQRDRPEEITLKDFCGDWLKVKKREVRPDSFEVYEYAVRRLMDYFGPNMLLHNVTPRLASKFIAELKPFKGETLSGWSRLKTLRNCKTIFQTAVTWELIPKNPFTNVKAPKCEARRWHYLKPQEYRTLLTVAPSLQWQATYALAYTAALRFGELFSLTWADVDFENNVVRIENRAGTATIPPFYVKGHEKRDIPLPKHTLDILTALQSEAPEREPYILLNERQYETVVAKWKRFQQQRRPWRNRDIANNRLREFKRHLRWAGIQPNGSLSLHTLRKSCVQNWANHLPPNVTKELAGHASISTTMEYYAQVDEDHRIKAAAVIESLVSGDMEEGTAEMTDARMTPKAKL